MLKSISIILLVSLSISCRKDDKLEDILFYTDFSDLDGWTTHVGYNTNINGDTAWVDINNNQLVLNAFHKEASEQGNFANATYDFSHLNIDANGIYIFEIGVVSPGIFNGEPNSAEIFIQFDTWVFSCKGYSGEMMTDETIIMQLDLSNHTHAVNKLSNNEDLSSTFIFYENTFVDPAYKITFTIYTGSYMSQYDNSLEAKFDFLKITKAKD